MGLGAIIIFIVGMFMLVIGLTIKFFILYIVYKWLRKIGYRGIKLFGIMIVVYFILSLFGSTISMAI